jgi:hypothetical protein
MKQTDWAVDLCNQPFHSEGYAWRKDASIISMHQKGLLGKGHEKTTT